MSELSAYLESIARYPLLTKNQEILLGRRVQAWISDPEPSSSVKRSGERAYHKLINCNLRLVVSVAKRYRNQLRCNEMLDLISEGNLGLAQGIKKFDPERGYALSTYVYWWIRQSITRFLAKHDRMIHIPNNGVDALTKISRWSQEFRVAHGRSPSIEECADHANISIDNMRTYLMYANEPLRYDHRLKTDDPETPMMEILGDGSTSDDALEAVAYSLGVEYITSMLNTLNDVDRRIICHTYGIDGHEQLPYNKIGVKLEISRERVRQRHNRAVIQMRLAYHGIKFQRSAA
jgi:RNA polymerase nonessential primary-like sigma factor